MLLFAEHLHEEVLEAVPHRHLVLTIPRRLRPFFRYDRARNRFLFKAAQRAIKQLYSELTPSGTSGAVLALHSGNDLQEFNPHIHGIVADGVFLQDGSFEQLSLEQGALAKLFEYQLLKLLLEHDVISEMVIAQLTSWKHSGFSAWLGKVIHPSDQEARLFISEYVNKAQIKNSKIEVSQDDSLFHDDVVRCHKDENTYRDYTPLDYLAHLSTHIPNRWEQTVRYIGHYSARTRGKRRKELEEKQPQDTPLPFVIPEEKEAEYKKSKRKSWARLIRKVFEVDPLVCPKCGQSMKVVAVIIDPKEANRISSHLGYRYRAPPPFKNSTSTNQFVQ